MADTSAQITLPTFMIIGASKCGTTSLWEYLNRHPALFWAEPKEPMFFNRDENYSQGVDWYANLFSTARNKKAIGEATTSYSYAPHTADVPQRIHELLPECKLIYMLRPPVSRTYSHYVQELQVRVWAPEGDLGTFENALEVCPVLTDAGMYLNQIEHFLRYFRRDQMKILLLEDLKQNPNAVVNEVLEFIGLDPIDLNGTKQVTANSRGIHHARNGLNKRIEEIKAIPGVNLLTRAIPKSVRTGMYHRMLDSKKLRRAASLELQVEPAQPKTNEKLRQLFRLPNKELGEFLGRDLGVAFFSHWDG